MSRTAIFQVAVHAWKIIGALAVLAELGPKSLNIVCAVEKGLVDGHVVQRRDMARWTCAAASSMRLFRRGLSVESLPQERAQLQTRRPVRPQMPRTRTSSASISLQDWRRPAQARETGLLGGDVERRSRISVRRRSWTATCSRNALRSPARVSLSRSSLASILVAGQRLVEGAVFGPALSEDAVRLLVERRLDV
jgi:hypothetical protein